MSLLEELRWKKFPVLDQGYVCLVDVMGEDQSIVQAARVSYGAGTKAVSSDRDLIRYLFRHGHTTPVEMVELKLLVRIPMDSWRQYIRHRTASVNEYSTRYSEAIDAAQQTEKNAWRKQATVNKQGSTGTVDEWPEGWELKTKYGDTYETCVGGCRQLQDGQKLGPVIPVPADIIEAFSLDSDYESAYQSQSGNITPGWVLSEEEKTLQSYLRKEYERRLKFGVAREQARKDLPLSTYTEAYWKCDLHNIFNFLSLRMDSHAQQEIRSYATVIGEEIVAKLFPIAWESFNDYNPRRGALLLTRLEVETLKAMFDVMKQGGGISIQKIKTENKREQSEWEEKAKRLGLGG